ncbi:MAG TPA: VWA domain-containing protein [Bryobacteraceae bacterium]|nr:VWA domain-containing protein [Bryobacteraceae bacterium]
MSCSRRSLIIYAGALVSGGALRGRQEPTFSSEVKVVNILATVRDKSGAIVRNLTKEDFRVFEDGRPQEIRYFSQESDLPLTIGLLVDTSFSQGRVLEQERAASYRFLDEVLRQNKDKAVVVQFDQAVVIRQELTSSHKDLQETLSLLDLPTREQAAEGSGTLLYDAVRTASVQVMRTQPGRKAFVVLTDGVDEGSTISLTDAIEAAQRADTLVYSILFSDASYYGGRILGPSGANVLKRLSKETGGGYFEVSKTRTIGDIYDAIQEELRSEYSLGFVSDRPVTRSGFRALRVITKEKGLLVQARDRYYAET